MADEKIKQLGEALGLDPSFLADVDRRGQRAIVDRVATVDGNGSHGRLLSVIQQFGEYLDDATIDGEDVRPGALGDALSYIGRLHGMNAQMAVRLGGAVLEVYQQAASRLAGGKGQSNGTRNATQDSQ